jgi:hypothetical protein
METLNDKNITKESEYGSYTLLAAGVSWRDATSYGQGQRYKVQPSSFELKLDGLRIFITCGHIYYKGTWIMGCYELNMKEIECRNCKTATEAAEYAVRLVKHELSKLQEALNACS